jgi:hypothetical protein
MAKMKTTAALVTREARTIWTPKKGTDVKAAGSIVCAFLDTATTSMGRATHYNTREDQQVAEMAVHESLLNLSRDLYAVMMGVPGITDRAVQLGVRNLLSSHRDEAKQEFLTPANERQILAYLLQSLPPQRMLKAIQTFRIGDDTLGIKPANNKRTKKLILRTLLNSEMLPLWTVKYNDKMREALYHAWGERLAKIIRTILAKTAKDTKERTILIDQIGAHCADNRFDSACECVSFILGNRSPCVQNRLLRAYMTARTDLKAAATAGVPLEVLEGFRAQYHKEMSHEDVVKLLVREGGDKMSAGAKKAVQRQADKAGVKVDFDPASFNPVELYIYAFERGLDEKIAKALDAKARKAAASYPAKYERIGIVVDASKSMEGDRTQHLRPMAATLALRDMLTHVGDTSVIEYVGGSMGGGLLRPAGDTSLAEGLVKVLSADPAPEAVYVLSDGYENAPSGRFAEVVDQVREIGIETPIYHLNPVFAAESRKTRELAPQMVPTMPVNSTEALGSTILRGLIESEPIKGINALLGIALTNGPVGALPAGK